MAPMRDLLVEHSEVMGAPGQGIVARIDASLNFAEKLWLRIPNTPVPIISPRPWGQIEQAVKEKGISFAQVLQAAMILTGSGALLAVQDEATTQKAKKHTDKLNAYLMNKARSSGDISYLASPVTGGGITVGRFQQLFLLAKSQGKKQPAEWAEFVWQVLASQGQRIIKEGKTLETAEENLAELTTQANTFAEKQLPILKALGI